MHAALARQEREGAVAAASSSRVAQTPSSPAKAGLGAAKPPQQGLHIVAATGAPRSPEATPPSGSQGAVSPKPEAASPQSRRLPEVPPSAQPSSPSAAPGQSPTKAKGKARPLTPDSMEVNVDDGKKQTEMDTSVKERGD